ncbi:MAG: 23S rRNA pseudouridine(1911/1915/1917) synthase RluD [Woeseia sp.]
MAEETQTKTIPQDLAGQRFDQALARMFPEYSRSRLKSWILQGFITADGGTKRPRDLVSGGETVSIRPADEPGVVSEPEAMELDLRYEDPELMVVNKPAGLVVHPGAGNPSGTLMNGLLHRVPGLAELPRAGIIHRLDKDTSGLLLIAKTLRAHTALVRMLAARKIARHYVAVCNGVLTGGGTIDAPIGRHPVDRLRMSVHDRGKPAVTVYRVLERFAAHTYISVELESGRTHQIRVHFAYRRHPIVGDQVYGGRPAVPPGCDDILRNTLRHFRRQALHAARLEFEHPETRERVAFDALPPADFENLLNVLRQHADRGES